jgi:hypothetical protein
MIDKDGAFVYTETKTLKGSGAKFDLQFFLNQVIVMPMLLLTVQMSQQKFSY